MRGTATLSPEITRKTMLIAFAATLGMMTSSPPIVAAPQGLLLLPITEAFHIGRGTLSLLNGISLLIGAALTPLVGQAIDCYGVRRIVMPGIIAFGLVQCLFAIIPLSTPMLGLVLMLQGIASCLVTPLAYTRVISLWFQRRRGVVLGVVSAFGIGGGGGIAAGIVGGLLAHGGWRLAYLGTGIYILAVGALVIWPFLHEPTIAERASDESPVDLPGLSFKQALATPAFRLVMVLVVGCISGLSFMMGHGPALLSARGLNIGTGYVACAALGSLSGQILSGVLLDRIDSPKVGLGFAMANFIGGVTILYFGFSAAVVLPAAIVMGLGQGAETGLASYYVSRFCGLRAYASIFAVVMMLVTLSAGVFPTIAGYAFDNTGSYDILMPYLIVILALPAIAIFFMPRYRYKADLSPIH